MIFFIKCGEKGPIKIGVAADPAERVRTLQTANHEKLYLLASIAGDRVRESQIHSALAGHRINGEWFQANKEVFAFIAGLQAPEYETEGRRAYAVLRRSSYEDSTAGCPFCGKPHWHGVGDGHRVAHCVEPSHPGNRSARRHAPQVARRLLD